MDPNRPLGIKSEPVESSNMTTIPQAIRQAVHAAQCPFTAATIAASDSITVATTSAAATKSTAAAKATPAKKATATVRKPAAAKREAAVKTPAVPKTAAAAKAAPKATSKATPKTAAAKATPTTNTQAEAEVTPTTTTGTGTARPRGRPKKNADANGTATTSSAAATSTSTSTTDTAKATISPPPAAPSSPIIVATANRPATATSTANHLIPSPSPSPGPGPAPTTATTTAAGRQTTNTRGRGRGRGTGSGRGRGRGRGGASTSRASSSTTTPARKRTASAASIADADADTDPADDDVDADAYGRASKQRKVATTEGIAAPLRAFEASRAGSASASGAGSGSGSKQVVRAAASGGAGGSGGKGGAAGPGTSVGKKGWSVDGQEINRRHKENDLHLLETGEFSDATIHCLKKKWKVHKMRLSTRSAWFREAFAGSDGTGQISEINLHEQNAEDIETMLRFMYADSLDDNLTRPSSLASPITTYVTLYNLGHTFRISLLCRDSITLLGQYLDTKLLLLCTYSVPASGRSGVIDYSNPLLSPQSYANDLFSGIFQAYSGVSESTKLHSLLASFLWAGRDRLFRLPGLRQVVDQCPMLGTDVFKLQLGDNSSSFIPPTTIKLTNVPGGGGGGGGDVEELKAKHFGPTCSRLDHTRKTQHPDRCEACDEVFDEERWAKRVYNPFKVVVRPAAWCRRCVEGKTNPNAPGGGKGGKGGIGGRFDLGVGGPMVVDGDGEGAEGGNGESHRKKGVLEDVVPMWRLRVGGDEE
ncbi:hypothetical protein B0T13DRAFT_392737 [Neurospora crassa]|nr:hypothetical protein B0T13DRAFT_392737 [Neurospora crassa]